MHGLSASEWGVMAVCCLVPMAVIAAVLVVVLRRPQKRDQKQEPDAE